MEEGYPIWIQSLGEASGMSEKLTKEESDARFKDKDIFSIGFKRGRRLGLAAGIIQGKKDLLYNKKNEVGAKKKKDRSKSSKL